MGRSIITTKERMPDVRERMRNARLYCVTCPPGSGQSYEEMTESACRGGADIIQLREKNSPARELKTLAGKLVHICRHYGALFILNDRVDIALSCSADGVHLGQEDLPLPDAKKMAERYFLSEGPGRVSQFLVGCSTHSLEQALKAENQGADYIACGPVFPTPTKPDYPAVGLNLVRDYSRDIKIPFVAIGGIDETNIDCVIRAGARCVAVVRAVCGNRNIEDAARFLKKKIVNESI